MKRMQGHTAMTRRILVLCSDAATGRVIEEATRAWMFETVVCSSLRAAESLLDEKDFALIFCQDRFEDGSYQDLLSIVRGSEKVPVVVMISNLDQDFIFREAMALGALGVVASPCSIQDAQWMVIRATEHGTGSLKSTPNSRGASAGASHNISRRE